MAGSESVGILKAVVTAETDQFESNMGAAAATVQGLGVDAEKTQAALDQLTPRMGRAADFARQLSGAYDVQKAEEYALAIGGVGNAATLSETAQAKVNATMRTAIDRYRELGQEAPAHMVALEQATRKTATSTETFTSVAQSLKGVMATLGIGVSVGAIVSFAKEALNAAGTIVDLSNKTGLSTRAIQVYGAAAELSGSDVGSFADAVFKLGISLEKAKIGDDVANALTRLGLSLREVKALAPEDQFAVIADRLHGVESATERNTLGTALFGQKWKEIAPAVVDGLKDIEAATHVVGDAQVRAADRAADAWDRFWQNTKNKVTGWIGNWALAREQVDKLTEAQWNTWQAIVRSGGDGQKYLLDLAEATAKAADEQKNLEAEVEKTTARFNALRYAGLPELMKDFSGRVEMAEAKIKGLTTAQRENLDAAKRLGDGFEDLAREYGLSEDAIKLYTVTQKENTKETKKAEEEFKRLRDQISGAALQRDVVELDRVLRSLTPTERENHELMRRLADAADDLSGKGAHLTRGLAEVALEFHNVQTEMRPIPFELKSLGDLAEVNVDIWKRTTTELINQQREYRGLIKPTTDLADTLRIIKTISNEIPDPFKGTADAITARQEHLEKLMGTWREASSFVAQIFGDISSSSTGAARVVTQAMADIAGIISQAFGPDGFSGADLAGGVATFGAAIALDAYLADAQRQKRKTELLALLAEMRAIAVTEDTDADDHLSRPERKSYLSRLEEQYDEVTASANEAELAILAVKDAIDAESDAVDRVRDLTEQYGISFDGLGQKVTQADLAQKAMDLADAWDFLVNERFADSKTVLEGMNDEAQQFVTRALKLGIALPESMRPMLQAMVDLGMLTDENGVKLEDLSEIDFEVTLADSIATVAETIADLPKQLVDAFKEAFGLVSHNADGLVDDLTKKFDNFRVVARIQPEIADAPNGTETPDARTHRPSFQNRPLEVVTGAGLAMLHPGDVVGVPGSNAAMLGSLQSIERMLARQSVEMAVTIRSAVQTA